MLTLYTLIASSLAAVSLSTFSVPASDATVYSFGAFPDDDSTSTSSPTSATATTTGTISHSTTSTTSVKSSTNSTISSSHATAKNGTATVPISTNGAMQLTPLWAALF